jgi:hypothetical protein
VRVRVRARARVRARVRARARARARVRVRAAARPWSRSACVARSTHLVRGSVRGSVQHAPGQE